jgi:hypothetical protein
MQQINAIYIDFECLKTKPSTPVLLGVLKDMGGEQWFEQVVLDHALASAAHASHLRVSTFQGAIETLAADAEVLDCGIVGWSYFDRDVILDSDVPAAAKEIVGRRYKNALETAKPWKAKLYPEVKIVKVDRFAAKNTLDKFAKLAGYDDVGTLQSGEPAKWIKSVQKAMKRAGHYRRLKKGAKNEWRSLLDYNEHDCRALRHILLKAEFELDKWQEYERTKYCFQADGGRRICFMIDAIDTNRDDLLARAEESRWALITAWNPASRQLSAGENANRQFELAAALNEGGHRYLPGEGIGQNAAWPPEESLFVIGISKRDARALGRRFGQFAIVVGHKGFRGRLVRC